MMLYYLDKTQRIFGNVGLHNNNNNPICKAPKIKALASEASKK